MDFLTRRTMIAGLIGSVTARNGFAQSGTVNSWRDYAPSRFGQVHLYAAAPAPEVDLSAPPLVCLHQSPTSGSWYREFQMVMATDRLVLCPDTPGYGKSDHPPEVPSMADYGAAMIDMLKALGFGPDGAGPVDLLGFHTGNFVAMEMAIQAPEYIRKMVMPSIPYFPPEEREKLRQQYAVPRPYFEDPDYMGALYARSVLEDNPVLSPERRFEMFTESLNAGPESWYAFEAVFTYEAERQFAKLTHPILLPILDETLGPATEASAPMIKGAEILDMKHHTGQVWFVDPDAMADAIRPFLSA